MNGGDILPAIWFLLLGVLLTGYAILDGINLGVGIATPFIGKNEEQRGALFTAIGPFWAGYEVWLVAVGGSMVAAFPRLYADAFSGFYLVLTLVLWLLIARGGSIEFRNAVNDPLWRNFWDFVFFAASALLALLYGAAVGNVIRGVPLDARGNFQGSFSMTLNLYAIGVGLLSVALLTLHGINFIAKRAQGALQAQARNAACRVFPVVALLTLVMSAASFYARADLGANFREYSWLLILPLGTIASLAITGWLCYRNNDEYAVLASGATVGFLMASAGASLYPRLLPAHGQPANDLTIYNCAAPRHDLLTAMIAYVIAMALILTYTTFVHRVFKGKMVQSEGYH